MASFKKIPIVQVTKFDKSKIFEYIQDKYTFTPINKDVIINAVSERLMLDQLTGVNEDAYYQLEQSKEFLTKLINKYSFYIDEDE
jgi:hypothetical protein